MKLLSVLRRCVVGLTLWSLPSGETRSASSSRRLFINGKLITLPALSCLKK